MYCEDNLGTDIEHFWPKAAFPGAAFQWDNHLWACSRCNSNYKRDRFPMASDEPLLIDPTRNDPFDHLVLSPLTGLYVSLDEVGENSIEVFGLNREVCVRGRRNAWVCQYALIRDYERGSAEARMDVLRALAEFPFQGVRLWLRRVYEAGDPSEILPADVQALIGRFPELLG